MPVRKANAVWEGGLKDGHGTVKLGTGYSGTLDPAGWQLAAPAHDVLSFKK